LVIKDSFELRPDSSKTPLALHEACGLEAVPALTAEPEAAVLIEIQSTGALTVDGRALDLDGLPGYLQTKLVRNPMKSVIVQTSMEAPYYAMTDVFDELRHAGVRNVVIPTHSELELYGLRELP
jgi:biopolymer transport protein ExbD